MKIQWSRLNLKSPYPYHIKIYILDINFVFPIRLGLKKEEIGASMTNKYIILKLKNINLKVDFYTN